MPMFRVNEKNVLYIHVPKTGGTSIEAALARVAPMAMHDMGKRLFRPACWSPLARSLPLQHAHGDVLRRMFTEGFFDYTFMIVRDPLERMKSEYRHARGRRRALARLPFDHWLSISLKLAKASPHYSNNHFMPQTSFECLGAEVFRYEDGLMPVLNKLSDRLGFGCPNEIPHERRGSDVSISISRTSREMVKTFFDVDYRRYGYN